LSTARDITEHRQAEDAVRRSQAELAAIFDSAPVMMILVDRERCVRKINHPGMASIGHPAEEIIGQRGGEALRCLHALDDPRGCGFGPACETCVVRRSVLDALETGNRHYQEEARFSLVGEGGREERYFLVSTAPLDISDERMALVCLDDVTELKRAEQEQERLLAQIQEQARRTQQIMDTVPEVVLLLDEVTRVVLVNPLGKRELAALADAQVGDTLTRLGGRPLAELLTSPPRGLWHEVSADGRSFQVIARPLENGPEPQGWVLVVRDVTQQRDIEQRTQQQERLAAVGQLAAGIAHDFNNIMSVISLYADISLRVRGLPTAMYERLETMDQQARRATELIQQILDFSRRAPLEPRPMDLLVFMKEQVKLLERTLPEHIQVDLTYNEGDFMVNADPTRMQQAMMNLAVNARDAMPKGGRLRIGLERVELEPGEPPPVPEMGELPRVPAWVRVTVTDNGAGIPPDVVPHIFDPFFTTKARGEGTGLGLAQVYGIIKQHEGHVDVESAVDRGTTFILYLPAMRLAQAEAQAHRSEELAQGQGETILVVEDSTVTRQALVEGLELLGYRVLQATNGWEALTVYKQFAEEIALVVSDLVMPGMGGQALFHALREQDPTLKVVMLSGHPLEHEMEDLRVQGLSAWLPKPPDLRQLSRALIQALGT
jgi:signal transduction histidine kinase/ActR/RegA family two-component response regulator